MNRQVEAVINDEDYNKAVELIEEYKRNYDQDSDIYMYQFLCCVGSGEINKGLEYAKKALREQPYVAWAHYNCAYAYEINNRLYEAYEEYVVASEIAAAIEKSEISQEQAMEDAQRVISRILDCTEKYARDEWEKHLLKYITNKNKYVFGVRCPVFIAGAKLIGDEYYDYPELPPMYVGISGLRGAFNVYSGELSRDTNHDRAELQRVSNWGDRQQIVSETECYLPVIVEQPTTILFDIDSGEKQTEVANMSPYQYVNYRLPKGSTTISSDQKFRIGEVVPIGHDERRKKLVLNIFVDGLSQTILKDEFKELMPHTYAFFKKGMICTNAHTAGDWTYPSIASIVTGQELPHHKMLHSKILRKLNEDTPILFEYFKNAGYNTTKIGGNWRIAPNYGYARGMNRVKYQHMYTGFTADQLVAEVEEQIHNMSDTDQFIWMEIGELHLIADELNMAPLQSNLMVWENEQYTGKKNSVKQKYDETKIKYYKRQIAYVDRRLASLYAYIEENYSDEEILVSLFADHGQGYLIKPDEDFLSDGRSNIAFMFRGGKKQGITDEIISSCDYAGIMCSLAGIEYDYSKTDAMLPVAFGGSQKREFCVTESIHVGDPYEIVLNGHDFIFCMKGLEEVTSECRVPLDEYEVSYVTRDGEQINDERMIKYYTDWCLRHVGSCRIYNN